MCHRQTKAVTFSIIMEGVPENALQPLYFVGEMLDTDTSQLACADTQTPVFQPEKQRRSMVFVKKLQTSSFESGRPSSFIFGTEKRHEPFFFYAELITEYVFSARKRRNRRQFQSKTEGSDAMTSSRTSQPRDLANPLGVEPLSP